MRVVDTLILASIVLGLTNGEWDQLAEKSGPFFEGVFKMLSDMSGTRTLPEFLQWPPL